jgi:hypothetical protein
LAKSGRQAEALEIDTKRRWRIEAPAMRKSDLLEFHVGMTATTARRGKLDRLLVKNLAVETSMRAPNCALPGPVTAAAPVSNP